jgi:hypothetical protein
MSEQDIKQVVFAAIRNSMMARGAKDGFDGNVWPLTVRQGPEQSIEQATESQYGLQGILEKESPHFFGGWSPRYAVLKGARFVYKETASPVSPNAGILNFNLLSCEIAVELKRNLIDNFRLLSVPCRILIKNCDKQFVFKGITQQQTQEWYAALAKAARMSDGWERNLSYLAIYPRFWRVSLGIVRKTTSGSRSSDGKWRSGTFYSSGA